MPRIRTVVGIGAGVIVVGGLSMAIAGSVVGISALAIVGLCVFMGGCIGLFFNRLHN
jgi:hypothetical protein